MLSFKLIEDEESNSNKSAPQEKTVVNPSKKLSINENAALIKQHNDLSIVELKLNIPQKIKIKRYAGQFCSC